MQSEFLNIILQVIIATVAGAFGSMFMLGKYKEKVDTIEKSLGTMQVDIKELLQKFIELNTKVEERTTSYASTLIKRKSPISLTEKGNELLYKSGADKFILKQQNQLIKKIKDKKPKSAYDIQEYARQVIQDIQNDDKFVPLKDFAYQEGIELTAIIMVMAIDLRDKALPLLEKSMIKGENSSYKNISTLQPVL